MQSLDLFNESVLLQAWADENTRSLDLVASWENLCETYDVLRFIDPISDTVRLEEFKWIIKEMNKFLTRVRKKLMSAKDLDSAKIILMNEFTPNGNVNLENRKSLAYQKLKQRWIMNSLTQVDMAIDELIQRKGETDGSGE